MQRSLVTIDNTPLCRLILAGDGGAGHGQIHGAGRHLAAPSYGSLAGLPRSLAESEGVLINSSVPDFSRLPPCPYGPDQVAILVSALTPISPTALRELGYQHLIDKDHGFAALCQAVRHWRAGLSQTHSARSLAPAAEPELLDRLRLELTALIDAKLISAQGDIHAHLEQVVTRWLSQSLDPKIGSQISKSVEAQLPGLVADALSTELDRLTAAPRSPGRSPSIGRR